PRGGRPHGRTVLGRPSRPRAQVLRRRGLRRRGGPAGGNHLRGRPVEGRGRRPDRSHRQRRRQPRERLRRGAAPVSDRLGSDVRNVAVPGSRRDSRILLLAALMHFPILTSLIRAPVVVSILLLFVKDDERSEATIRVIALVVSTLVFAESLLLWYHFNQASAEFQFVERHAWIPAFGISYFVGVDGISLLLVVLTAFLTPVALLSSWESVHQRLRAFAMFVLLLESAMIGVF